VAAILLLAARAARPVGSARGATRWQRALGATVHVSLRGEFHLRFNAAAADMRALRDAQQLQCDRRTCEHQLRDAINRSLSSPQRRSIVCFVSEQRLFCVRTKFARRSRDRWRAARRRSGSHVPTLVSDRSQSISLEPAAWMNSLFRVRIKSAGARRTNIEAAARAVAPLLRRKRR
jgi:hypothetical protein